MKNLRLIVFLYLLLVTTDLAANDALLQVIRSEFNNKLPAMEKVIGSYQHSHVEAKSLVVGDFRINDDKLFNRSKAIAEILRYRLNYLPKTKFTMLPPHQLYSDAQFHDQNGLLVSRAAFKRLFDGMGVDYVLTGSLALLENNYFLSAEIIESGNGESIAHKEFIFSQSQMSDALNDISRWAYLNLGVELSDTETTYLDNTELFPSNALADFISFFDEQSVLTEPTKLKRIRELRLKHSLFPLLAMLELRYQLPTQNLRESANKIKLAKQFIKSYPDHSGILSLSIHLIDTELNSEFQRTSNDQIQEYLRLSKLHVLENPADLRAMNTLGSDLVEYGMAMEGIAVLLELVERRPDAYRDWWSLGYGVEEYAWKIRGNDYASNVSSEDMQTFKKLIRLADRCIDKALSLNSENDILWVEKLHTLGSSVGFSPELIETFDSAIKFAPNQERIYLNAMNFSLNKWGGTAKARLHVGNMAQQHNPDALWAKQLWSNNISKGDEFFGELSITNSFTIMKESMGEPKTWKVGLFLLFVILFGMHRARVQQNKVEDEHAHTSDYYED